MDKSQIIEQLTKDFIIESLKEKNVFYMGSSQLEDNIDRYISDTLKAASTFNKSLTEHINELTI